MALLVVWALVSGGAAFMTCYDGLDVLMAIVLTAFCTFIACMMLCRYLACDMEREKMNLLKRTELKDRHVK